MYAITGATGNTGGVVAEKLLADGEKVRVIGRDTGRLARFLQNGAEAFATDLTNAVGLSRAFDGARAVYALVPPSITSADVRAYQERVTDALTAAIEKASVPYAVVLSSFGADKADMTGPVVGLHNLEQKLNGLARLNALYLRAGYFMENLLPQVAVIQNFGIVGGPLRADLRIPMIATRDIGGAAAELLRKPDFAGKEARELLGQRDLYAVAGPATQTRARADGHVLEHGRPASRNGRGAELGLHGAARTALRPKYHGNFDRNVRRRGIRSTLSDQSGRGVARELFKSRTRTPIALHRPSRGEKRSVGGRPTTERMQSRRKVRPAAGR